MLTRPSSIGHSVHWTSNPLRGFSAAVGNVNPHWSRMKLSLIAAVSENGVIGSDEILILLILFSSDPNIVSYKNQWQF